MLIDFVLGSPPPPPENQFHDGIDSHKESILWNRCLGSLKQVLKFGLWSVGVSNTLFLTKKMLMKGRRYCTVLYIKKEPKLYLKCIFSDLVNAKTKTKPQKTRLEEMDDAYYSI
jgi:hypothetical protein